MKGRAHGRLADTGGTAVSSALFSFALGVSGVLLPLAALADDYSYAAIGVLTAISGVAQLASRGAVPALARRLTDRSIVGLSGLLMGTSCLLIVFSTHWVLFVLCQVAQGVARGFFWTASQLHAVRTEATSLRGIARINLFTSVGLLAGPVVAGVLAHHSMDLALVISGMTSLVAGAAAMVMAKLPTLARPDRDVTGPTLRHRTVLFSGGLSAAAGAWSAIMVSFVPVLLANHHPVAAVGVLVMLANAGNAAGSYLAGRIREDDLLRVVAISILVNGATLATVAFVAPSAWLSGAVLLLGGLGAGALLTLGPAVAANLVSDDRRAGAIALAGGARAGALMLTPLAIGGVVAFLPLTVPVTAVGLLLCLPLAGVRLLDHGAGRDDDRACQQQPPPLQEIES